MDPNAAWAIVQGDGSPEEKAEALRALIEWHERGGFVPDARKLDGSTFTRYAWWIKISGLLRSAEQIIEAQR